jgi:hypothetical protein
MTKIPKNAGKPWTPNDVKQLAKEVAGNTPTRVIALHMAASRGVV